MSDSLAEIDIVFGSEYTLLDRFTNGALSSLLSLAVWMKRHSKFFFVELSSLKTDDVYRFLKRGTFQLVNFSGNKNLLMLMASRRILSRKL